MKTYYALGFAALVFGCAEAQNPTADAIGPLGQVHAESGLGAAADLGGTIFPTGAHLRYDPQKTTARQVAAAPAKVCAFLKGTVRVSKDVAHPVTENYPSARVLEIACNIS